MHIFNVIMCANSIQLSAGDPDQKLESRSRGGCWQDLISCQSSKIKTGPGMQADCFAYHTAEMLSPWHKEIIQINSFLYMSWISLGCRMLICTCEQRKVLLRPWISKKKKEKCVGVSTVPSADMHVFLVVSLKLYKRQIWKQSAAGCRHREEAQGPLWMWV